MGMWDRMKSRLGLSSDYDDEYDDEEYYEEDEPVENAEAHSRARLYSSTYSSEQSSVRRLQREPDIERAREPHLRSVPDVDQPAAVPPQVNMYICKPRSFSEAQTIGDRFKASTPVILDLSTVDPDLSKRFVDFASGLTYGRDGGLQKVSERVFLLTPANVTVSAEDRRRLKDTGLFTYDV